MRIRIALSFLLASFFTQPNSAIAAEGDSSWAGFVLATSATLAVTGTQVRKVILKKKQACERAIATVSEEPAKKAEQALKPNSDEWWDQHLAEEDRDFAKLAEADIHELKASPASRHERTTRDTDSLDDVAHYQKSLVVTHVDPNQNVDAYAAMLPSNGNIEFTNFAVPDDLLPTFGKEKIDLAKIAAKKTQKRAVVLTVLNKDYPTMDRFLRDQGFKTSGLQTSRSGQQVWTYSYTP